jgi:hypothetical protein
MLSTIKSYLLAALAFMSFVLLIVVKVLRNRAKKAEHDLKVHEVAKEIERDQNKVITESLSNEKDEIKRKTTNRRKSVADINSL